MMHDIVAEEFERHLEGTASHAFYRHLDVCAACREEVAQMDELSSMMRSFRMDAEASPAQPPLGFYHRVADRIVEKERREAWGLFSPGVLFFRRVAFASLLLLAGLGSYLVARESGFQMEDAASIMAQHDPSAQHDESADRDRMLVTMATYR